MRYLIELFLVLTLIATSSSFSEETDFEGFENSKEISQGESGEKRTSELLRNVIEFYNGTVIAVFRIEKVLKQDTHNPLNEQVLRKTKTMESLISRLEEYLMKMKDGKYDRAKDYETFIDSIYEAIDGMADESAVSDQTNIEVSNIEKINQEKEQLLKLLESLSNKMTEFDESIAKLETYKISLRNPKYKSLPSRFNISLLTRLMKDYEQIEKYESIKQKSNHNSESQKMKIQRKLMQIELEKLKSQVKSHVQKNAEKLKQFVPIINSLREKVVKIIPEMDAQHIKMGEEILARGLGAYEANNKMLNLIKEVEQMWKEFSKEEHAEL